MTSKVHQLGQATLDNYVRTRRELLRVANGLTVRIAALEPVRTLEQMNAVLALEEERKVVVGMIASCSYIIDWLAMGRMPGNRRGIERRSGSQREILTDPSRLNGLQERAARVCGNDAVEGDVTGSASGGGGKGDAGGKNGGGAIGDEFRMRLEEALAGLTERERDCYVLAHGECFTFTEIAGLLGISKSSVGTYMTRAQRKITLNVTAEIVRVG